MKNIHIIPTDKPSRLHTYKGVLNLAAGEFVAPTIVKNDLINQNIYITNSEEVKEGDWIFNEEREPSVLQCIGQGSLRGWNKIILTTDQSLIQDGVQVIDDEFLEFFVKNPSCDEVETYSLGIKNEETGESCHYEYEIIIPKVEPKQLNSENFGLPKIGTKEFNNLASGLFGGKPKQETVEEAAERLWLDSTSQLTSKNSFIQGAKWGQERMYSEEDLISFAHFYFREEFNSTMQNSNKSTDEILQDWFNQFKKK